MRADLNENAFKLWLSELVQGKLPGKEISSHEMLIQITKKMMLKTAANVDTLIEAVFGKSQSEFVNFIMNKNTTILTPKNERVLELNEIILNKIERST
jgi:hypothetical protein